MDKETFKSAYVNGEFSTLEAMKSLDRENEMLRRDLEKVRRKRFRLAFQFAMLADENERLQEIIEDLRLVIEATE